MSQTQVVLDFYDEALCEAVMIKANCNIVELTHTYQRVLNCGGKNRDVTSLDQHPEAVLRKC